MKKNDFLALIKKIFEHCPDNLNLDTKLVDIKMDSMDIYEFLAILEKKHKKTITPQQFFSSKTLGDILEVISV
jgi:acyl carrier protein